MEFEAASQWYAASLTIDAEWLRNGATVAYSVAAQPPENIRDQLNWVGLGVTELEVKNKLTIDDWYTATLGVKSSEKSAVQSLKVADLSIEFSKHVKHSVQAPHVLMIMDNISSLAKFNDEKSWVEFELARRIPLMHLHKHTAIRGVISGIHSDWVYKNLEAAVDGVIDFKLGEEAGETVNLMRIRTIRNVGFDSRWHRVKIGETFAVSLQK